MSGLGILRAHKNDLEKFGVKRIDLLGSFARGGQKRESDIGLVVEFDLAHLDKEFILNIKRQ